MLARSEVLEELDLLRALEVKGFNLGPSQSGRGTKSAADRGQSGYMMEMRTEKL